MIQKNKTLIETKAEEGYVIIAPTNGPVNPAGSYDLISGGLDSIATITPEERRDLFALARTFHVGTAESIERTRKESGTKGGRPRDDFNARATWEDTGISMKPNYRQSSVICFSHSPCGNNRRKRRFSPFGINQEQ